MLVAGAGAAIPTQLQVDDPDYQRKLKTVEEAYGDRDAIQCCREFLVTKVTFHMIKAHKKEHCYELRCLLVGQFFFRPMSRQRNS